MNKKNVRSLGLTLVEVLIILVIIGLLATMAIPGFLKSTHDTEIRQSLGISQDISVAYKYDESGSGIVEYKTKDDRGNLVLHRAKIVNWKVVEIDGKQISEKPY